jgi:acyl-CoA thioester hydrolase
MALSETFVESVTVVEEDLDEMNHVTNLQYMLWTLKAAAAHSKKVGWSSDRCREIGAGWIVRSHKITYKVPALLGDRIEIRTWIEDFDKVSSMRKYEIVREMDGRLCALAETRWVFVDLQTAKLREIPEFIIRAFRDGCDKRVDSSKT